MEFENMNINEVEEIADVIEDIVPKKSFKLTAGTGVLIGAIATAAVVGVVGLVKKVRAKKACNHEGCVNGDSACECYGDDYEDLDEECK